MLASELGWVLIGNLAVLGYFTGRTTLQAFTLPITGSAYAAPLDILAPKTAVQDVEGLTRYGRSAGSSVGVRRRRAAHRSGETKLGARVFTRPGRPATCGTSWFFALPAIRRRGAIDPRTRNG